MGGQADLLADSQSDVCGGAGHESAEFPPSQSDGVVSAGELAECLRRAGQDEWCTRVRLGGLLLLIDFVSRHHAVGGFPYRLIWPTDLFPSLGRRNRAGRCGSLWRFSVTWAF